MGGPSRAIHGAAECVHDGILDTGNAETERQDVDVGEEGVILEEDERRPRGVRRLL